MTTTAVLLVPKKAWQNRSTGEAVDAAIERVAGTGPMRAVPSTRRFDPHRVPEPWTHTLELSVEDAARLAERHLAVQCIGVDANRAALDPTWAEVARSVGAILAAEAPWTTLGLWRALLEGSQPDPLVERTVAFADPEWPSPRAQEIVWLGFS